MQREIGTQVDIGKTVSPFESMGHVPSLTKQPLILIRLKKKRYQN